jgi:hypothetical protein
MLSPLNCLGFSPQTPNYLTSMASQGVLTVLTSSSCRIAVTNTAICSRCFTTTLDEDQMRTSVWWVKPKIGFLMEPYRGFPHVKASVYDCPSNGGRVVYEYMRCSSRSNRIFSSNAQACSTTMANDARLAGSVLPEVRTFSFFALCFAPVPPTPRARSPAGAVFPAASTLSYSTPQYWQWPGDVEALVVDLTHRVCVLAAFL